MLNRSHSLIYRIGIAGLLTIISVLDNPAWGQEGAANPGKPARDVESKSAEAKGNQPARPNQDVEPIPPARRRELRQFVRENLPELEKMLAVLSERNPQQAQRVLASVDDSYSRLQAIKQTGNEKFYAQALENWKIDAGIKMVSTQLAVRDQPALQKRLKRLIGRQVDSRLDSMREEQARLQARLATLESNLSKLESERETEIARRFDAIVRNSEQARVEMLRQRSMDGGDNKRPERPSRKPPGSGNENRSKPDSSIEKPKAASSNEGPQPSNSDDRPQDNKKPPESNAAPET